MNFIQKIIHAYKVNKFFRDGDKKFKEPKVPTEEELSLIAKLERIPLNDWYLEEQTIKKLNPHNTFRMAIETKTELGIIKIRDEGNLAWLDIEGYDTLSEDFLFLYENIDSTILKDVFCQVMKRYNPDFIKIQEREQNYEDSKLKALTKEMSDNLFRADDPYSKRSYKYSKGKWVNGEFIENPSKYNANNLKEHKYFNRRYFNSIKLGSKGYVVREYVGKTIYIIYKCEVIKKDFLKKRIVFKVEDGIRCKNDILDHIIN